MRPGGIEKWLKLVEATGLSREQAIRGEGILPATRYAVGAYVDFVSSRTHLEAVASSLTELFSKESHHLARGPAAANTTHGFRAASIIFKARMTQAPEDANFALAWVVKHARNREEQELALGALARQMRYFVGHAGRALFCIRRAGLAAAGCISTREGSRVTPELTKRPRLAPGCRLNEKSQPSRVLLMPERALRLNGPSLEIVERCDGSHTVQQIVAELQKLYSKAEPQKVEQDILGYLERLKSSAPWISSDVRALVQVSWGTACCARRKCLALIRHSREWHQSSSCQMKSR